MINIFYLYFYKDKFIYHNVLLAIAKRNIKTSFQIKKLT
jgi:hypothetical protein